MGTPRPYLTFSCTQDESISTIKWILRDIEALGDKPSFVSHIGDISYARGYSWLWDEFFNQIEHVASKVPYHVCIGNHEYDRLSQPWKPEWSNSIYGIDGEIVATKEKLILYFVENHDGEVHDMVEILASGLVLNGGDGDSGKVGVVLKDEVMQYSFSHYVWAGIALVLGGFVGYVLAFVSHARKQAASESSWTSVKSEET
ncbi:hypothetical protein REPUB_Repub04eG0244100 [Reevesia pubescens]